MALAQFATKSIKNFNVSYPVINMLIEYLEMSLNMIFYISKDNTPEKLKEHVEKEISNSKLFSFLGIKPIFQESKNSMIKFVSEYADMEERMKNVNYNDLKLYLDYVNYAKINNLRERILACGVYLEFEEIVDKIKNNKLNEENNFNVTELVEYLATDDINDRVATSDNSIITHS